MTAEPPETPPQKRGPKPKLEHSEALLDQLRTLGRIFCTVEDAADVLRVSLRTLQNFFAAHEDAKLAFESGKGEGRASLRRKQFAMSETNAGMAIWLGKQYLGQKDQVQTELSGTIDVRRIERVIVDPADKDG